jgi:parallel beta-helix repeat protein
MKRALQLLAASAVVVGGAVTAPCATATTGPMFVNADMRLAEDHLGGSIFVVAPNVTLNCAGHTVDGEGVGPGAAGVYIAADGVTATNCVVRSFTTGVFTGDGIAGARIVGNMLTGNDEGVRLAGASGALVSGNTASANAFWGILACCGSTDNTIGFNTTKANRFIGIALNEASSNRVVNNTATANETALDFLFSSGNTIARNTAAGNRGTGFNFIQANDNLVDRNVSASNGSGSVGSGFAFNASSRNRVTNNIAARNGSTGFNASSPPSRTCSRSTTPVRTSSATRSTRAPARGTPGATTCSATARSTSHDAATFASSRHCFGR